MTQNMEAPALETDKEPGFPEDTAEIYRQAKRIIEGILFCSNEPISLRRMKNALEAFHPLGKDEVLRLVKELGEEYETQDRAFRLEEIAKGYLLRTSEEINPYILSLIKNTRPERLSHAAAEVLAIVAFRQPITRPQIDEIRGVDCSGIIYSLLERQLIEPVGKMEVPGRPTLFGVTNNFLKHFGLKDLKDLPKISESKKEKPE